MFGHRNLFKSPGHPLVGVSMTPSVSLFPPTDQFSDEGVVAGGGSSGRGPDPVLSVPHGDGTRPPAEAEGVHAAAQKQSKNGSVWLHVLHTWLLHVTRVDRGHSENVYSFNN